MLSKQNANGQLWKMAISDSSHYMVSSLSLRLMTLLVIPVLTRSFGIEEFALFDLFLSFYAFLFIILGLGLDSGAAILLTDSKNNENKQSLILVISLISSLCMSILFLLTSTLFLSIKNPTLFTLEQWVILGIYITFGLQSYLIINFCRFNGQVKAAAYTGLSSSFVGMSLGLMHVVYLNGTVTDYMRALLLGSGIGLLISLFIVRRPLFCFRMAHYKLREVRELFNLSLPFVPNYVGNSLIQLTDRFVLLALLDLKALGIYALANRIAFIPSIAVSIVSQGFLPVLLRNYASETGKNFSRQVFHLYVLCIPIFMMMIYLVSEDLIDLFGGDKFVEASAIMPIMVCSVLIYSSTYMGGFGFIIKRKTRQIANLTYFSLVINLIASYFLGLYYGILGIVIGTLSASIVRAILYMKYSEKLYQFNYRLNYTAAIFFGSAFISILLS